jgi:hypothetical protein
MLTASDRIRAELAASNVDAASTFGRGDALGTQVAFATVSIATDRSGAVWLRTKCETALKPVTQHKIKLK